jgi:dienelactone hydrolase
VEKVTFPTLNPFLFRELRGGNARCRRIDGAGELYMPEGPATVRRPAVVVLEGLGGLKESRERHYGRFLAEQGFVTLVVDTFGARNRDWLLDNMRAMTVTEAMFAADGYAALRYLQQHPAVDPARVYSFGFSYGAMISTLLAYKQIRDVLAEGDETFAGHVAYYGCSIPRFEDPTTTGKPVLMILGEKDRNVSIKRTHRIAQDLRRGGSHVDLQVLPRIYHQWDGADIKRRFVLFNLRHCAVQVDRNFDVRDEVSGTRMRGSLSRALILLWRASPAGYHILRNEEAIKESNAQLLSFLSGEVGEGPYPILSPAARTRQRRPRLLKPRRLRLAGAR